MLDTISDFVGFLSEVESLLSRANVIFSGGGIEDLLAIYLLNGYSFLFEKADLLIIDDTIFKGFVDSDDYRALQTSFKASYIWDKLIEHYTDDLLTEGMFDYSTKAPTSNQLALVEMALQTRGHRANLAEAFIEFLQKPELKVASRVVLAYRNTAFVFHIGASSDREARVQELSMRCLVVRGRLPDVKVVVGISTDMPGSSEVGYSSDIAYVNIPEWTDALEEQVNRIQKELGYFENASWTKRPANA